MKDTTSLYSLTPISLLPFSLNSLALILPEMAGAKSKGQSLSPHMAGTGHSCRQRSSRITLLLLKLSSLGTQDAPPSLLCLLHILGRFLVSSAAEQCRAPGLSPGTSLFHPHCSLGAHLVSSGFQHYLHAEDSQTCTLSPNTFLPDITMTL